MSIRDANHPLDYPIWTALTTTQQALAEGDARARRYPTEITPFAATADMSPESFAALRALMSPQDIAVLFTPDAVEPPAGFKVALADTGEQMIGTPIETPTNGADIVTLGADDVPAMIELTALTKPGPFSARTHELGTFLGIRVDGQLVAMIGERMKPARYTEITAVCVHPDHRGRAERTAIPQPDRATVVHVDPETQSTGQRPYSYRSASIGSSFAARIAG